MRRCVPARMLLICVLFGTAVACAADAPPPAGERPAKLGLCVACHGEDGRGQQRGQPHIAGQDLTYLRVTLLKYRDGTRRDAVMNAIAGTLSPADIDALAAWYAVQPCVCTPAAADRSAADPTARHTPAPLAPGAETQ